MARKRNQHRNKSTRFDCVAPNKMRTSSIVNVHVKHKASYGRHMFNAELHNAHVQNKQAISCLHDLNTCTCNRHIVDTVLLKLNTY